MPQYGELREALVGPRQVVAISYQTPYEELLGTPVAITATSEPAEPQVQYTVQAGDMPALIVPYTAIMYLIAAGVNNDGSTRTLNWRFVKWSGSAWTSLHAFDAGVTNAYYWTLTGHAGPVCSATVAPGDIFGFKLWCTASGTAFDYRYRAAQVQVSRVQPDVGRFTYMPIIISCAKHPNLSTGPGTPYQVAAANPNVHHLDSVYSSAQALGPTSYPLLAPSATYRLVRASRGDAYTAISALTLWTSARCPYYTPQYVPTQLEYRRVPLRFG